MTTTFCKIGRAMVASLAVGSFLSASLAAAAEDSSIVAPGAKVEKLADGFKFTEGPAADADGNVYFTDQPNDRIMKWSTDGKLSTFLQPCGRSNGLCFDQGAVGLCGREERTVAHRSQGQGHGARQGL